MTREDTAIETCNEYHGRSIAPGLCGTCPECQSAHGMAPREFYQAVHESQTVHDEGGFSWSGCDCCGSQLGGNLYAAHGFTVNPDGSMGSLVHLDVCADCVQWLANGEPFAEDAAEA